MTGCFISGNRGFESHCELIFFPFVFCSFFFNFISLLFYFHHFLLITRVVRKVRRHPLYNLTGTMTSFIMYIIILNNVSGINMRKMMVIQSAVYLLH